MTTTTRVAGDDLSDAELMVRVQGDDADAFGALYDRFDRRAYGVVHAMVGHPGYAEDVVQEAFVSLWRSRASYDPRRGEVASWVLATVRNRAIDAIRRNSRHDDRRATTDGIDERLEATDDVERASGERSEAAHLRALLDRLPAAQREVIALAYFGELSASEIANELVLPVGTVKGRMRLGLQKLRSALATQDHRSAS